ncbi:peritrophin-48-like, partial [Rhagoletis pomonella]|uniref:peritrophin-48-like n=1 Tax=Rhagoletis pomonella TaxID=28610 RepID=UPI001782E25B
MKVTLLTVVALVTIAICSAADPECKYRKIRKLALHWANPTDCTRYYRCTNKSVKREVVCAEGKVYNARIGKCSTNRKGLCKLTLATPLDGVLNPCANEVSGAYLAQSGYCRNFYICNNNEAYPQDCDAGSRFNATTSNCIPDTESECWQNKCINKTDGTYLPDASSCISFYVCSGGEATAQDCGSSSYFNSSSSACEPDPTGEQCWENLCVGKKDGEFVKDVNDCHSYYVCSADKPVKQDCPQGSYFDWSVDACIPGECPSDETTTEFPTTETTISSTECTEESTESSSSTECTEATTTTTECPQVTTTTACPE